MVLAAWYHGIVATVFALVAILLMIVILLQRGRGVGLAGAFGGAGGATTFGSKTGDALTWITIVGAGIFMVFCIILVYVFVPSKPGIAAPPPAPGAGTTPAPGTTPVPAAPPASEDAGGLREIEDDAKPKYCRIVLFGGSHA